MAKRSATADEKAYMDRVAALGCAVCVHMGLGDTPACLHHPRFDQGGSQRSSHYLVLPLCPEHHQGASGIHQLGQDGFKRRYGIGELDILADTIRKAWRR